MITDDKTGFSLSLDDGFPGRVLTTSLYLSLVIIVCSLSYLSLMGTVSLAVGCFLSLIVYKILWWTIQYAVLHKRSEIKGFFLKVSLTKYGIIGVMLLSFCLFFEVNIVALSLGLGIVLIVLVTKIGSTLLVKYMNTSIKMTSHNIGGVPVNSNKKGV